MAENKRTIINGNIAAEIEKLKNQPGRDVIIFGSPTVVHSLMEYNLIDEYWLFVNPIIIGEGIPLFAQIKQRINIRLVTKEVFKCGVIALNYVLVK